MQPKQAYGDKPHGGVVAKALEPSPVVSNTTKHHDRLSDVVQSLCVGETSDFVPITDTGRVRIKITEAQTSFRYYDNGDTGTIVGERIDSFGDFDGYFVHFDSAPMRCSLQVYPEEFEYLKEENQ